jgi:ERCC4-type nuclease
VLKESVLKPMLIVEGEESLFAVRNVHPNSIYGMIATITISYGIPLLFTRNETDTSNLLFLIARREQFDSHSTFSMHASNKPQSKFEQMEYIVSAVPNVGLALAKKLLARFGSVEGVVRATLSELESVEGIGKQKAAAIREVLSAGYKR